MAGSFSREIEVFAVAMQHMNLMLYHKGFRFVTSDPTATFYTYPDITTTRKELLLNTFNEIIDTCNLNNVLKKKVYDPLPP